MGGGDGPGDTYNDDPDKGKSTPEEHDDRASELSGATDLDVDLSEIPDDIRARLLALYSDDKITDSQLETAAANYRSLDPDTITTTLVDPHEFDIDAVTRGDLQDTFQWILEDDDRAVAWVQVLERVEEVNANPIRRDSPTPDAVEQGLLYAAAVRDHGHKIVDFKTGRDAEQEQEIWEDTLGGPEERTEDPDHVETAIVVDFITKSEDQFVRLYQPGRNMRGQYLMRFSSIRGREKESLLDVFAIDEGVWGLNYSHVVKVVPPTGQLLRVSPSAGFQSRHPEGYQLIGTGRQYGAQEEISDNRWLPLGEIENVVSAPERFDLVQYDELE